MIDRKNIPNGVPGIADAVMTQIIPMVNDLEDRLQKVERQVAKLQESGGSPPAPAAEPPATTEDQPKPAAPKRRTRRSKTTSE